MLFQVRAADSVRQQLLVPLAQISSVSKAKWHQAFWQLFQQYILEHLEGEPLLPGSLCRFRQASLAPPKAKSAVWGGGVLENTLKKACPSQAGYLMTVMTG